MSRTRIRNNYLPGYIFPLAVPPFVKNSATNEEK
jgi:hypothetical protein